jgi:hypothetical protein
MGLRQAYWRVREQLASPQAIARNYVHPVLYRMYRANRHRILAFDLCNEKLGFFAHLTECLRILAFCDEAGLRPVIRMSTAAYGAGAGADWFPRFIRQKGLREEDEALIDAGTVRVCRIASTAELALPKNFLVGYFRSITLERARQLVDTHLEVAPPVHALVEEFCRKHFTGRTVLGIHYRGTDKRAEAPLVPPARCATVVREFLAANPAFDTLFVTSDQQDFVDFIQGEFRGLRVCAHEDVFRSRDGVAVHKTGAVDTAHARGTEALSNCLTLARCHALVRTTSLLSAWASVIKPALPVVLLNRPYGESLLWFPEKAVADRAIAPGCRLSIGPGLDKLT